MWVLNIHGSVHSVPSEKYLSRHHPLGQGCCPLCLWGCCNSCSLLSPAGCCAGAVLCSPTAFPGREIQAWRGAALCFFCFWGWEGGSPEGDSVAKLPFISQLHDRTALICNPLIILYIACVQQVMIEPNGLHLTLALLIFLTDLVLGVGCIPCNAAAPQLWSWEIVLINAQG